MRALADRGITRLEDVAGLPATELHGLHGIGPKAMRLLSAALAEHDLQPLQE